VSVVVRQRGQPPAECCRASQHGRYIQRDAVPSGRDLRPFPSRSAGITESGDRRSCEKFEKTYNGPFPAVVEISDDDGSVELSTPARVAEFVAAVHKAAGVAFPTDPANEVRRAEQAVLQAVSDWCNGHGAGGDQGRSRCAGGCPVRPGCGTMSARALLTTGCPAWCGQSDDHPWIPLGLGEASMWHRRETGRVIGEDGDTIVIAFEVMEASRSWKRRPGRPRRLCRSRQTA
jgi:hypothetical protein